MSSSVVIPDLHGTWPFLAWVLERFPERSLIFLGDLINRGPDSRRVLQTALGLAEQGRAVLLWGNHEEWAYHDLKDLAPSEALAWCSEEGRGLFDSYGADEAGCATLVNDIVHRFASLARPYIVEGEMLCAHAARPTFGANAHEVLGFSHLWDRPDRPLPPLPTLLFPEVKYSVHGHTIVEAPVVDLERRGVVYLDLVAARQASFACGTRCIDELFITRTSPSK